MPVDLITGKPGAGKSYEATAYYVLPALQKGRHVVTNLPLNIEAFKALNPAYGELIHLEHKRPENLRPFAEVGDYVKYETLKSDDGVGPLYIIDESQEVVPAGNKNTPREIREWYALHRHAAADVILMTQSVRKLNREVTDMVRYHIQLKKNDAFGSVKSYARYTRDGMNGEALGTVEVRKYKKQYFQLYQTHTKSGGTEVRGSEKTLWSHWIFRYAMPVCVIALVWAFSRVDFSGLNDSFSGNKSASSKLKHKAPPPPPGANLAPPSLTPHLAPYSKNRVLEGDDDPFPFKGATFLISGRIAMGGDRKVFLSARTPDGRVTRVDLKDLEAAGYRIVDGSECYIALNYKQGAKLHKNFASCGQLQDLPPIYYLDPTRQIGGGGNGIGGTFSGAGTTKPAPDMKVAAKPGSQPLQKDSYGVPPTPNYQVSASVPKAIEATAVHATPSTPMEIAP